MFRSRMVLLVSAIAAFVIVLALGLSGGSGSPSLASAPAASIFPVRVDSSGRYLVDASGKPFFLHGDAAWSLIVQATDSEVDQYLADRQQKGFNAILVNLLEHKFANQAPRNIAGATPFTAPGDYGTPNEAYFAHADSVIHKAASRGILVLLTPSYLGYQGGDEGWYREMSSGANGATKMYGYGRYLGKRYRDFSNILWVNGGDFNPPSADISLAGEIVRGIRDFDTHSLHTVHCDSEFSPTSSTCSNGLISSDERGPWLQVNSIYTYGAVDTKTLSEYAAHSNLPVLMIESRYENEDMANADGGGTQGRTRSQAYQAILSGAMGHVFGNNPVWHFSSKASVFPIPGPGASSPSDWKLWLDEPGSRSMTHLHALFTSHRWWNLVPDALMMTFMTSGRTGLGGTLDNAVAARARDDSFAIVYMPSSRAITLDLKKLVGPKIIARWYDPANGTFSAGTTYGRAATSFIPAGPNSSGSSDWVLLLESTN